MTKKDTRQKDFLQQIAEVAAEMRRRIESECDGFLTDPEASERRRTQGSTDFGFFCRTYFPHHVRSKPSEFHEFCYRLVPEVIFDPKGRREAIAAPRGNAKTTTLVQLAALWVVAYGHKRYPVIGSDAFDQAAVIVEGIKAELQSNPRLAADFPELVGAGPVWQVGVIVTRNGAKVQAAGSGKRLRGYRHGTQRPDLVLLDDLENDENVREPKQRDKLEDWIDRTVDPLGPPDGSMDIIYVGTILHYDAVLRRKIRNPLWHGHIFRAIKRWPDRMDLWDHWEEVLHNEGEPAADAFFAVHRAEMLAGAEVIWPEVQPLELLMKIRVRIKRKAFATEYQNEPNQADEALFGKLHFWVQPVRLWVFFGACDPSLGKHGNRGDPSAILVGGFDRQEGILDVVEASIRRRLPDRIIEDIITYQAEYRCLRWGTEVVQFQEFLRTELVKRSRKRLIPVPAIGLENHADKDLRIESIQPHTLNGLIRVRPEQTTLIEQLEHYPNADHDDGPDALEMLWRIATQWGGVCGGIKTAGRRAARAGMADFMGG